MITAYGNDETRERALAYGADGYLTKPIDFQQIKQTLACLQA